MSPSLPAPFCDVATLIPDAVLDIRYAGYNNFVGRPVDGYHAARAILTRPAARALVRAADALRAQGYRLCLFDAYRPQRAVDHFMRWAQDPQDTCGKAQFYPQLEKKDLFPLGYIAARSGHSRGSTVDLTLAYPDGSAVDMGGPFDFFGPVSALYAAQITPAQRTNRALLHQAMTDAGFRDYSEEWWHYTLRDEPYPNTYFDFPILPEAGRD
jgi:D-alanyl-D-alanine dipeptidase